MNAGHQTPTRFGENGDSRPRLRSGVLLLLLVRYLVYQPPARQLPSKRRAPYRAIDPLNERRIRKILETFGG